jgi:glycosyltransferase involved in cell wall biosynthesis
MKLYINNAKENWVVDRFVKEWNKENYKTVSTLVSNPDLIWLIAPWTWEKESKRKLKRNKVLCTIHHIDEDKFFNVSNTLDGQENFMKRDKFVDHYHVVSQKTYQQVSKLTTKPITFIPFWVNQNIWFEIKEKESLRKKYQLDQKDFLVGSFQRDTEGYDLKSPKLSKGPDQFVEIIKTYNKNYKNLCVILTGKRREYIMSELKKENIKYKYFEMIDFETVNELYNLLNLYIVSSRYEGGPQAILECATTKTPIISTDVGIASFILHKDSIFDMDNYQNAIPNVNHAYNNVLKYQLPMGFESFNNLLKKINEN